MAIARHAQQKTLWRSTALSGVLILGLLWTRPTQAGDDLSPGTDLGSATGSLAVPNEVEQPAEGDPGGSDLGWASLSETAGEAGMFMARGIARGDYRGYGLRDIFPLEQVFLPEVGLPPERHPSLLFAAAQADRIHKRTDRDPYSGWVETVLGEARASLPVDLTDPGLPEIKRAKAVKSCSFAWWTGSHARVKHSRAV